MSQHVCVCQEHGHKMREPWVARSSAASKPSAAVTYMVADHTKLSIGRRYPSSS